MVSHSARGPRGRVGEAAPQGERSGADEEHTRNESAATGPEATDGTGRTPSGSGGGTGVRQAEDERRAMPGAHHNKQRYGIQEYITERGEPAGRPAARESRVQRARRAAVNGATARKRQREEEAADGVRPYREATQLTQNKNQLRILDSFAPRQAWYRLGAATRPGRGAGGRTWRCMHSSSHVRVTCSTRCRCGAIFVCRRVGDAHHRAAAVRPSPRRGPSLW